MSAFALASSSTLVESYQSQPLSFTRRRSHRSLGLVHLPSIAFIFLASSFTHRGSHSLADCRSLGNPRIRSRSIVHFLSFTSMSPHSLFGPRSLASARIRSLVLVHSAMIAFAHRPSFTPMRSHSLAHFRSLGTNNIRFPVRVHSVALAFARRQSFTPRLSHAHIEFRSLASYRCSLHVSRSLMAHRIRSCLLVHSVMFTFARR